VLAPVRWAVRVVRRGASTLNSYSLVYIGITGASFVRASVGAGKLLRRNLIRGYGLCLLNLD
jgi:hypothetical protein